MDEGIPLDSIQAIAASFGASFQAEKIVDTSEEKDGTRYYKVRWIKYSWEPMSSFVNLEHLIRDFWMQVGHPVVTNVSEKVQQKVVKLVEPLSSLVDKQDKDALSSILTSFENRSNLTTAGLVDPTLQMPVPDAFNPLSNLADSSLQGEPSITLVHELPIVQTEALEKVQQKPDKQQQTGNKGVKKRRKIPGDCSICGKHFKSTTNIAAHKKLHTEERQFECPECKRKFRRKLHLHRHLESHAGVKSFVCEICGSAFTSKWYMEAHSVIHTGEKPFECDVCEKRFNNKANLNKHRQIHANKRPFVCNVCGQSYRQSYDLKRHMSTHSVSKDYVCADCGKRFARKTYLQRHMLTHSAEKRFACHICDRRFFQQGHLNFHLKQHAENSAHFFAQDPDSFVAEQLDCLNNKPNQENNKPKQTEFDVLQIGTVDDSFNSSENQITSVEKPDKGNYLQENEAVLDFTN